MWVGILSQMPSNLHKHSAYRRKPPTDEPMLNASDNARAKHHPNSKTFALPTDLEYFHRADLFPIMEPKPVARTILEPAVGA